jgi:hypothetical protein
VICPDDELYTAEEQVGEEHFLMLSEGQVRVQAERTQS